MNLLARIKKIPTNNSINQKGTDMVNNVTMEIKKTINIVAEFAIAYTAGKIIDRVLG